MRLPGSWSAGTAPAHREEPGKVGGAIDYSNGHSLGCGQRLEGTDLWTQTRGHRVEAKAQMEARAFQAARGVGFARSVVSRDCACAVPAHGRAPPCVQ